MEKAERGMGLIGLKVSPNIFPSEIFGYLRLVGSPINPEVTGDVHLTTYHGWKQPSEMYLCLLSPLLRPDRSVMFWFKR